MVKSKRMRWSGNVARMGRRGIHIGWEARRKEPLERPRHRWIVNIKMDLREIEWVGKDSVDLP
jgi:hypothetical protein